MTGDNPLRTHYDTLLGMDLENYNNRLRIYQSIHYSNVGRDSRLVVFDVFLDQSEAATCL
jgi:hypothetical protein